VLEVLITVVVDEGIGGECRLFVVGLIESEELVVESADEDEAPDR
jgi:hypothetical protein